MPRDLRAVSARCLHPPPPPPPETAETPNLAASRAPVFSPYPPLIRSAQLHLRIKFAGAVITLQLVLTYELFRFATWLRHYFGLDDDLRAAPPPLGKPHLLHFSDLTALSYLRLLSGSTYRHLMLLFLR
jgi:hypothetical protein